MTAHRTVSILAAAFLGTIAATTTALADNPMRFQLVSGGPACDDCRWIMAEGEIQGITPSLFSRFVNENGLAGSGIVVRLESPGGDLVGGLRLGREIRRHGLATEVGRTILNREGNAWRTERGECESACAYAFLGGVERYVESRRLGVHRHRPTGTTALQGKPIMEAPIDASIQAMIETFALDMGIDIGLVDLSLRVPAWTMHYLSDEELLAYNVVSQERIDAGPIIATSTAQTDK